MSHHISSSPFDWKVCGSTWSCIFRCASRMSCFHSDRSLPATTVWFKGHTHTDTRDKMRRKEHLFLFVLASSKKPWPYWLIWQDNDGIIAVYFILYLWTPLLRRMQPGSEAHPRSSSMVFPSDLLFKSERETQAATVTAEPSWAHLITEGAGVGHFLLYATFSIYCIYIDT